jgi:hypothetical protein
MSNKSFINLKVLSMLCTDGLFLTRHTRILSEVKFSLEVIPCLHFFFQGACVKKLSGKGKIEDSKATKQIVALLSAPLEKYNDIVTALKLSNYPRVLEYLDNETNKVMATVIIQSIMKNKTCISTDDKVLFYLLFIHPF